MTYKVAVIPAAGRGARLDRAETPKPLVQVGGEALLVRLLRQLEAVGVEHAIVVTGYESKKISRELAHHPALKLKVTCLENPDWADGLSSSVLRARDLVHEPFLLAMADHVFAPNLLQQMSRIPLSNDELGID